MNGWVKTLNKKGASNMKKGILIGLIAITLLGTFSISALGYRGQGPAGKRGGFYATANLNLTTDQKKQILEIRQDFQKDTLNLRFDMQKKNLELRELWSAKPLNQAAIVEKTKEVTALKVQMLTKTRAMQDKIKSVLTADQLKQYNENISKFTPGQGGRGKRGGGRMIFKNR